MLIARWSGWHEVLLWRWLEESGFGFDDSAILTGNHPFLSRPLTREAGFPKELCRVSCLLRETSAVLHHNLYQHCGRNTIGVVI
jgi:hypothetical protein